MKNQTLRSIQVEHLFSFLALIGAAMLSGCDNNDPQRQDVPELITKVVLTFTPQGGGNVVAASATDPDGEGIQDITVDSPINLAAAKTYVLTIGLLNELAQASDPAYNIAAEVEEEGDEHMFFFGWTNNAFSNPAGNGNLDNRSDPVNYSGAENSVDGNGRPLGLTTTWTTGGSNSGKFRVLLKHQPGTKTDSSGSTVGETDLDVEWDLSVQ